MLRLIILLNKMIKMSTGILNAREFSITYYIYIDFRKNVISNEITLAYILSLSHTHTYPHLHTCTSKNCSKNFYRRVFHSIQNLCVYTMANVSVKNKQTPINYYLLYQLSVNCNRFNL